MLKVKEVVNVEKEGLIKLLEKNVTIMCMNYFYNGKLIGVNDTCILLENPKLIYETGSWTDSKWKDAQSMGIEELYIQTSSIEAFAVTK